MAAGRRAPYDRAVILRSLRVVTPDGIRPAMVEIREGRIVSVGGYGDGTPDIDYGDLVIMPGLVDSHVHVNDPGRAEWEGFETATRAAAAGGVTTIVDMPLNSIPVTTTAAAVREKVEVLKGRAWVDVGLWGGAVPENIHELPALLNEGLLGFKCFLVDSGIPEFAHLSSAQLNNAAQVLRDSGAPLLIHAELPEHIRKPRNGTHQAWVDSRPRRAEDAAVELVYEVCEKTRARLHIVHLSSAGGLTTLQRARSADLPLTAETAPHYLSFAAEEIAGSATEYKCAPPIREAENRERLWSGLGDGLIDMVVTDHSPSSPEMKRGDFATAWGGVASLQLGLAATWTEARKRGFGLQDLARWMCQGPAGLAGLDSRKGMIAPGFDADLVIFADQEWFRVDPERIEHRHKLTPYAGRELNGVVKATYLRGRTVFHDGDFEKPFGNWIKP